MQSFDVYVDVKRPNQLQINNVNSYDRIILSPGPGMPMNHFKMMKIIDKFHLKKNILGICLGHQALAEYFGAKLINLDIVKHGISSEIYVLNNSDLFLNISNKLYVGHYHSWVVSKRNFPESLEITSVDKDGLIMSFRHRKLNLYGIQFHPESIMTKYGKEILKNWLKI